MLTLPVSRKLSGASALMFLLALLAGCAVPAPAVQPTQAPAQAKPAEAQAAAQPAEAITLQFTFWGSQLEKEAMLKAAADFEKENPGIKIQASHIPDNYDQKLTTMLAGNNLPDIGYMVEDWTGDWGQQGRLLDLGPLVQAQGSSAARIESAQFYGGGTLVGAGPELETTIFLYNKEIFDKAGLPYPPSTAETTWTWDQMISVAKKLTTDANGKHPDEAGFDAKRISQFGIAYDSFPAEAMLLSNDTHYVSPDGKSCWLDKPATLEVYQAMADAINVHHVTPSPDQAKQLPMGTWQTLLSTGKVAMTFTGQWLLLDVAKANIKWGIGAMPKFKHPAVTVFGMPVTVFKSTKHPQEAWKLLSFLSNPEKVDLYKNGLWMPVIKDYYTDPAKIDSWASGTPARPPEFKTAVLDYVLKYSKRGAWATLKNGPKISAIIDPEVEKVNMGQSKAADVLPPVCSKIQPLLQGFWTKDQ